MYRRTAIVAACVSLIACGESPIDVPSDDEAPPVRMEHDDPSMGAEWAEIRFKWAIPPLAEGETRYVAAEVLDEFGRVADDPPITYDTNDPDVLTVDEYGAVTGQGAGVTEVVARFDGLETDLAVDVKSSADLDDDVRSGKGRLVGCTQQWPQNLTVCRVDLP